jgi:hypothetical protein
MRQPHILDSAATLLGVSLIIVTAVHVTGKASGTAADELAFAAAILFLCSCAGSHWAITKSNERFEDLADKGFATGLLLLFGSVLSFWF